MTLFYAGAIMVLVYQKLHCMLRAQQIYIWEFISVHETGALGMAEVRLRF
jgi:hypothetical protein